MHAAYDDLPEEVKQRLKCATAVHDFNKFWEMMRREKGSTRPALTEEQRRQKPAVSHPVFLKHPITERYVLYANPGYTVRINDVPEQESKKLLEFLFSHQLQPKNRFAHHWAEGDVLMWDDIGTLHNAVADYGENEHRLIKRCQVMADFVFSKEFRSSALGVVGNPRWSEAPEKAQEKGALFRVGFEPQHHHMPKGAPSWDSQVFGVHQRVADPTIPGGSSASRRARG